MAPIRLLQKGEEIEVVVSQFIMDTYLERKMQSLEENFLRLESSINRLEHLLQTVEKMEETKVTSSTPIEQKKNDHKSDVLKTDHKKQKFTPIQW